MAEQSRMWWLIGGIVALALVIAGIFVLRGRGGGGAAPEPTQVAVVASPTPAPPPEEPAIPEGITLDTSDGFVREVVGAVSSNPALVTWLANKDLVRRFVASVHMIASGRSPRKLVGFARPRGRFRVVRRDGEIVADPRSYRRYDLLTEVVTSIDIPGAVEAMHRLQPLIGEAYREIGKPGTSFDETLQRAIVELLKTPVVPAGVPLKEKVVTYTYADPRLEKLSGAQRQLLRMGPDNVRRVQSFLRQLAMALGIPEDALPAPRTWTVPR